MINNYTTNYINNSDKNLLLPLLFIPCLLIHRILDNDVWFLLNSGRYVVNYGIPYIEPFTIHNNMEFVMQQWLTSVIYWIVYDTLGETGIYIIIMVSFGLTIFLMYKTMMLISGNNFWISYVLTFFLSIFIRFFMISRPMAFTLLLITLELFVLESHIVSKNKKLLLVLPIISLLMINLHAAMWPMLFIIMIPYIIDSIKFRLKFICGQGYEKKHIFTSIVMMIIAAFINPYGVKSLTYLFRSYGYSEISNTIIEMLPPNINDGRGIIIYLFIFAIMSIYCIHRKGKTRIRYFLLTIGTCVMTLSSIRSFPFFIVCSTFPLSYYLKGCKLKTDNKNVSIKTLRLRKLLLILIIIVTIFGFIFVGYDKEDEEFNNLDNATDFLLENENSSEIILYTGYGDGALAEFKGLKPYIDPRAEVFVKRNNKKDDIMKEYIDLQNGNIHYKNVLDKYNFTHLLVSNGDILNTYLPYDSEYEIIYDNKSYKIFVRIN